MLYLYIFCIVIKYMSPPEVWGPAIWTLFHTLIEKMNPNAYPFVINSMFRIIIRICQYLPCPECSKDASNFLAKIKLNDYKTKDEFKNMLYLFHNWVNAKKRKPLYNYINMNKYSKLNLTFVINDFIAKYNTKGNMKLLAESFQRGFVINEFLTWIKANHRAFVNINSLPPLQQEKEVITEKTNEDKYSKSHELINNIELNNSSLDLIENKNEEIINEEVTNEEVTNEEVINEEVTNEESTIEEANNEKVINEEVTSEEKNDLTSELSVLNEEVIIEQSISVPKSKKKRGKTKK